MVTSVLGGNGGSIVIRILSFNGTEESLCITSDAKVGVGIANPQRALEVAGDLVVSGTISGGAGMGSFRNRIINGDMRIAQRGTSFVGTAGFGYTLDRWYGTFYGAASAYYTISQIQSGLANFSNALQLQQTSTNGMNAWLSQSLETRDVVRFQGQPVTVSLWYRIPTSFSGTWSASLVWSAAADTRLTDSGVSYTTAASITLTNTTAWTYASFTTFVPLTAQSLAVLFSTVSSGVNGATIQITGVQLEKGSVATPFEVRPYATELALCQRYFETGSRGYYPLAGAYGASYGGTVFYKVTKRASGGTITLYDDVPTAGKVGGIVSGSATNGITGTAENTGVSGFTFTMTAGYSLAYFTWTSQSEL
jgi:hypothetical protein